jgi:hypothetical protein
MDNLPTITAGTHNISFGSKPLLDDVAVSAHIKHNELKVNFPESMKHSTDMISLGAVIIFLCVLSIIFVPLYLKISTVMKSTNSSFIKAWSLLSIPDSEPVYFEIGRNRNLCWTIDPTNYSCSGSVYYCASRERFSERSDRF